MRVIIIMASLLWLGTFTTTLNAQRNCNAMEYLEYQKENDPKRATKLETIEKHTQRFVNNSGEKLVDGIITIPVVVHVIYQTSAQNISDAQILSQIQVLNDDFRRNNSDANNTWSQAADTEIEFCLASVDPNGNSTNGITRKFVNQTNWGCNDAMKQSSQGGVDPWNTNDYLNMWVCQIGSCGSSGEILGYAQFPGGSAATDGVVMSPQYFGTIGSAQAPFDGGRTTTHEVGHWLNLRHIWGDGGCSVDDFVSDTPASDAANYGCASGHSSCGSTDMVQNYMDYSDDSCMNLFTAGQKTRMRALFEPGGARASLLNSAACGGGGGSGATCSDGIQNQGETGVDCGGPCTACPCTGSTVTVSITFDNYPEETSWQITNSVGATVASGGTYANQADGSTLNIDVCLSDGCYDFTISDAYGDGICCSYGNGSYNVSGPGVSISGGSFGSSETNNFCLGGGSTATCNDGIQNQGETGVDCGGPCTACATCNDGIQNQGETGVDCGGPCTACATCNDGIQNQGETGVDCGGPCAACPSCDAPNGLSASSTDVDASLSWNTVGSASTYNVRARETGASSWTTGNDLSPPVNFTSLVACTDYEFQVQSVCSTESSAWSASHNFSTTGCGGGGGGQCTYFELDAHDFYSNWGIWNDGGSDCARVNSTAYSYNDTRCARLRDNTNTSTMTTDNLDLQVYEELTVDFTYVGVSMELGEDFWLQISTNGGLAYNTVEDWARGVEFNNGTRYFESVVIPGSFSANTRIRFRCDASGNADYVYIDDVVISGCANGARVVITPSLATQSQRELVEPIEEVAETKELISAINLYPNPSNSELNLAFDANTESNLNLRVVDMNGKIVLTKMLKTINGQQTINLNTNQMSNGIYFVQLVTKDSIKTKKFVVQH